MEMVNPSLPIRILTDDGSIIHCKKLSIGPWNMDTTLAAAVAHGLGAKYANVLAISVFILADGGTTYSPLNQFNDAADPLLIYGGITTIDAVNINMFRRTGGGFDGAAFNDPAQNRGYVIVWYHE